MKLLLDINQADKCGDFFERTTGTASLQHVFWRDIDPGHCRDVARLPLHQRDPFDRMLIVQAMASGRTLLSCDKKFDPYGSRRIW